MPQQNYKLIKFLRPRRCKDRIVHLLHTGLYYSAPKCKARVSEHHPRYPFAVYGNGSHARIFRRIFAVFDRQELEVKLVDVPHTLWSNIKTNGEPFYDLVLTSGDNDFTHINVTKAIDNLQIIRDLKDGHKWYEINYTINHIYEQHHKRSICMFKNKQVKLD